MSDRRTIATDALDTLGTAPIDENQKRDAIHLAVEPVVAGQQLSPGMHIAVKDGIARKVAVGEGVGIVDPFLKDMIKKGQRFWCVLYPRTIRSLRHVWSHPSFDDEPGTPGIDAQDKAAKEASELWLRKFCEGADCPGYDKVMDLIDKETLPPDSVYYSTGGEYTEDFLHFSGSDAHGYIPPEFWIHAEIVLGRKLKYHPQYFSCSC